MLILFSLVLSLANVRGDPIAKEVIRAMDEVIADHVEWDNWEKWSEIMEEFWTEDMIYDTLWSPDDTMGNSTGMWEWWENEHIPYNMAFDNTTFNQMIFAAEDTTATTTTYANTRWKGPFCTAEPSENMMPATMRIFDFYLMRGNKIFYNWMMIDTVDLMLQAGHRVLPKAALREGFVRPPNAMDGIPAPISRLTNMDDASIAKDIVSQALHYDFEADITESTASPFWTEDMTWYGPVGFGMATNKVEYEENFIKVIREAFSDRHLDIDILTCEGVYCGANGYLYGVNTGMFLGEAPSNKEMRLRFGLHWRVDVQQGVIPEGYAIFDLPGFFIQNGINLYERAKDPNYRI